MITGPGSPSVLTNMLPSIEQHVNFIAGCISHVVDNGLSAIEPDRKAEEDWGLHVNEVADLSFALLVLRGMLEQMYQENQGFFPLILEGFLNMLSDASKL